MTRLGPSSVTGARRAAKRRLLRSPRPLAWVLVGMVACTGLIAIPSAAAQDTAPVVAVVADVVVPIPVEGLLLDLTTEDSAEVDDPMSPSVGTICGNPESLFTVWPDNDTFRFQDDQSRTQCGRIGHRFLPLRGAASYTVRFTSDRTIEETDPFASINEPRQAFQEMQWFAPNGAMLQAVPLFNSGEGNRDATEFSLGPFPLQADNEALNVTWYFDERGFEPVTPGGASSLPSTGSGHAFRARVMTPKLVYHNVELGLPALANSSFEHVDGQNITTRTYVLTLPDLAAAVASRSTAVGSFGAVTPSPVTLSVTLEYLASVNLVGVRTTAGTAVPAAALDPVAAEGRVLLRFSDAVLDTYGSGPYELTFVQTAALPPPTPPAPPARIDAFVWIIMLIPLAPMGFAFGAARRYRIEGRDALGASSRSFLYATSSVALVYGIMVLLVVALGQLATMATLPISAPGAFGMAQFVLVALVFVALAILPARILAKTIQRDLESRKHIQAELERSNRELEQFAYVASHDLQEPLRTISGFSSLLRRRYGDQLDEKALSYIERTVQGTERMQALINDLLSYSRVQTRGEQLLDADLNTIVARLQDDLETFLRDRKARIMINELPTLPVDRTQIAQLFSNLIRNAVKYQHPDRDPVVSIAARDRGAEVEFIVEDNGRGIDPQYHERIFQIFQRLEAKGSAETGTGIGLAIARRIVERHGGRIWVESAEGHGASFHFTLHKEPPKAGVIPSRLDIPSSAAAAYVGPSDSMPSTPGTDRVPTAHGTRTPPSTPS